MVQLVLDIESMAAIDALDDLSPRIKRLLPRVLNRAGTRARTEFSRRIRQQIRFGARYLGPSEGRLSVTQRASASSLLVKITGRGEPTSLARFAVGSGRRGRRAKGQRDEGVNVTVKAGGSPKMIRRAWLINLRNNNVGLAVRTDGPPPAGAYRPKRLNNFGGSVWLLYGPSVDQALYSARNQGGVVEEVSPELVEWIDSELVRQIEAGI
jgi:hypothetical protein